MNRKPTDAIAELRASLAVLSPAEIEKARTAAETARKWLGDSHAMQAEMAATILALVLNDMGSTAKRADLADVLPAVEALAMYVVGRMPVIVRELGNTDA